LWAHSTPEVLLIRLRRPSIEILPAFDLLFAITFLSILFVYYFCEVSVKHSYKTFNFVYLAL
jgi:hypothetical protein